MHLMEAQCTTRAIHYCVTVEQVQALLVIGSCAQQLCSSVHRMMSTLLQIAAWIVIVPSVCLAMLTFQIMKPPATRPCMPACLFPSSTSFPTVYLPPQHLLWLQIYAHQPKPPAPNYNQSGFIISMSLSMTAVAYP